MPTNPAIARPSNARRLGGSAALVAAGAGLAAIAVHDVQWVEWGLLAVAGVVGAAGVGLARRSMTAQLLARATAWTVLAPSALVAAFSALSGQTEWVAAAFTAASGGALLLARPMLHTAEARAQFHPSSFRRWLLAGATASAAIGLVTGLFALEAMRWHPVTAVALAAYALSLIASGVGVVRMRAWGILLGGLTAAIAFVTAMVLHNGAGYAMVLTAIPGFMLLLPVLVARRERAEAEKNASSFTRIASPASFDETPARVRVTSSCGGALAGEPFEADEADEADGSTASPAPQAQRARA